MSESTDALLRFEKLIGESPRLGWDEYHMLLALVAKLRSPSQRLKVGCTAVDDRRVIATGYNGFLPGAKHEAIMRDGHEQNTVHAEQNMVADCASRGVKIHGATAYVTHFPCLNCAKVLAAAKIKEVKYWRDYRNDDIAAKILADAGIMVTKMLEDDISEGPMKAT